MDLIGIDNKCEATCPARATQEAEVYGQRFGFCDHHYNEFEPALIASGLKAKVLEPAS